LRRKHLFWLLPAGLAAIFLGTLLALPGFVASQNHRPAMERFASSLTGREVHIEGNLSLALLPRPRLTASRITIAGPDQEVISAKSLALDISLPSLLRGQLAVQTLNLDSPVINFPWPLPGGPGAIAPPPWLAALHAHLNNATITLGGLGFTQINADLFTGPDGAVSISGNGLLRRHGVTVSVALGAAGLDGTAPLSAQASAGPASATFTGTLNVQSVAAGQITLTLPGVLTGSANLSADGSALVLTDLKLQQGQKSLSGSASFDLTQPRVKAELIGQNLDFSQLGNLPGWATSLPADITLDASNIMLLGTNFPALSFSLNTSPAGRELHSFSLSLPGGGTLAGNGKLDGGGALSGQVSLAVPDSAALLATYHLPALSNWPSAHLTAKLAGTAARPALQDLTGTLGTDHVTGNLVLGPHHVAGQLGFDHLALAPLAGWAGQSPPGTLTADLEVSAQKAEIGPVKLDHFALDASLDDTLNVRDISAGLYGGLARGSFMLDSADRVSSAQGFLDIPSAAPLAALLPAAYVPPPSLLAGRLNLQFAARGPANALAASAVARLTTLQLNAQSKTLRPVGDLTVTSSPLIDLPTMSASGAITAQYPEAILLARFFGLDQGLAFPGAGSASIRARFTASSSQYGLDDFILSFGALNASGRVMVQNGAVSGRIDVGALALPPIPAGLQFPAALPLQGKLALTARQLLYAGHPLLGPAAANLSWTSSGASLDVAQAVIGGGKLSGSLGMGLSTSAAPAFTAKILAQNIDATSLALPIHFPYSVTGTLSGNASLTASGYGLKSVLATLGGNASLNIGKGVLHGFNLQGFADMLGKPDAPHGLYKTLMTGSTAFTSLNLAANLANGNASFTSASLAGPAGQVSATGGIDLYDHAQALQFTFTPTGVQPPVSATMTVLGSWATPKHIAHLKAAMAWKPAHAAAPAAPATAH
jgi:uncharacterized protein involved in outer membrane biogenesis